MKDQTEEQMFFHSIIENHEIAKKRKVPRELTWREIKERYLFLINQSKVLNGELNYEL